MECIMPRVNPKVSYGLWVMMMCRCRFIDYNNCTTLVMDIDNGGGYGCMGVGGIWEVFMPFSQFCCECKIVL